MSTKPRPELSFDGRGINGPDKFRSRVATFGREVDAAQVKRYGRLFAGAPDLLAAAKAAAAFLQATGNASGSMGEKLKAAIAACEESST